MGLQEWVGMLAVDAELTGEALRQFFRHLRPVPDKDAGLDVGVDDLIMDLDAEMVELFLDEEDLAGRDGGGTTH